MRYHIQFGRTSYTLIADPFLHITLILWPIAIHFYLLFTSFIILFGHIVLPAGFKLSNANFFSSSTNGQEVGEVPRILLEMACYTGLPLSCGPPPSATPFHAGGRGGGRTQNSFSRWHTRIWLLENPAPYCIRSGIFKTSILNWTGKSSGN